MVTRTDTERASESLTLRGAARVYGLNRHRISRAIREGELDAYRVPGVRGTLVLRADLEAWLRRFPVLPDPPPGGAGPSLPAR